MRNIFAAALGSAALATVAFTGSAMAQSAPAQTAPAAPATAAPAAATPAAGTVSFVTVPATAVMSERLSDLDIRNAAGDKIGEIEDVVIDGTQVTGYVISVGGFLGMGDREVVVSPQSVTVVYDEAAKKWNARMEVTKDQLKNATEYKRDEKHKD
ncbi:PRC-barrel domain-containing protein [Xanthobacteraceae bacterium A53D]